MMFEGKLIFFFKFIKIPTLGANINIYSIPSKKWLEIVFFGFQHDINWKIVFFFNLKKMSMLGANIIFTVSPLKIIRNCFFFSEFEHDVREKIIFSI